MTPPDDDLLTTDPSDTPPPETLDGDEQADSKPKGKPGRKTKSREEFLERIDFTAFLLGQRLYKSDIKKALKRRYHCSARQCEDYISRARQVIFKRTGKTREQFRRDALAFYDSTIQHPGAKLEQKLWAQERMDKITGVEAPSKVAMTDPTGERSAFLTVEDVAQALREHGLDVHVPAALLTHQPSPPPIPTMTPAAGQAIIDAEFTAVPLSPLEPAPSEQRHTAEVKSSNGQHTPQAQPPVTATEQQQPPAPEPTASDLPPEPPVTGPESEPVHEHRQPQPAAPRDDSPRDDSDIFRDDFDYEDDRPFGRVDLARSA
jgi:hypothetical protein